MSEGEKTLISIVTYNSKDAFTVLESLKSEIGHSDQFKIVVYDNNSTPAYKKKLKLYQDIAEIIFAEDNIGFGKAHNIVLKNAKEKYGFICNPDVLVKQEDLLNMVQLIKNNNDVALLCPKVLNIDGSTQYLVRSKLTVFDYFLRFVPFKWLKRMFSFRIKKFECRDLPEDENSYIRMGSGCFMLVDIEKFRDVDGFDEKFFMYFEDNDLCLRFEEKKYKIMYTPFSQIKHLYARGSHHNFKLFRIFMKSMFCFFHKWGWKIF